MPAAAGRIGRPGQRAGSRELKLNDHPIKGNWGRDMFGNDHPIVLELGCGKGDYTVALARRHPDINYIGVDIKGARLWKGAKEATQQAMPNVAFLRTRIEFIEAFFGPGEVSEIWLTFSDPQLRGSENARLSSPLFLERYRKFLKPGGIVHLKTDSRFLYEYTQAVCKVNDLKVLVYGTDIYEEGMYIPEPSLRDPSHPDGWLPPSCVAGHPFLTDMGAVLQVQTFYEKMFLEMGLPITYMAFVIDHEGPYAFPGEAFDHDYWLAAEGPRRSFSHQPAPRQ
ncbi:MAG: tRNA (guanosine(46)-N7)-methyltransferase TrmB [Bacteroidales bacterium]|nr:tRNA (guanosine(46)-N7)-methyltransferase TrmB [Bacteroidales bacterium]